jgi:arsenate reductase
VTSDAFAGIGPSSVPGFVLAQLVGLLIAVALPIVLYPDAGTAAGAVVVPADSDGEPVTTTARATT